MQKLPVMKKIYILLLSLVMAGLASAQNRQSQILWNGSFEALKIFQGDKNLTDTLFPPQRSGCDSLVYIYTFSSPNNGYVAGTNSFGDLEKGQAYTATMNAKVTDVLIPALIVTGSGNYTAKVYAVSNDTVIGSVLGQSSPTNLQTPGVYVFPINSPPSVTIGSKFMVSTTVNANPGDTLVVPMTAFGCGARESFEKWSDNIWYVVQTVYGDDADFFIGAVLMDNTSVQDLEMFTTMVFPSPADQIVHISAGVRKSGLYTLHIFNQTGALVKTSQLGFIPQGSFNFTLNLDNLASGIYTYRILSNEAVSSGRFLKK